MLSSGETAIMQAVVNKTLPDTCVIHTKTEASDGQGGMTETWAASGTVDCRISPTIGQTGVESERGGRITTLSERVVTLPASTTIDTENRLVISSKTYEVKNVRAYRSYELSRRVECVEVD